ncbi:MAG: ATP-binding protein [Lachnoclostridium edouardi]|uniref:ATP-binding protein n=1 Tax=Lachnoclostridium edouardi TaxID=1926283 RepID=UPI0026DD1105|nr:ATP-binding protein [Lachnoclostridium edouardi]MDO4279887.1 ATP-binding protein [Lachnoclostridium edouardi]
MYADRIYIANDCIFLEDWTISDLIGKHRSRPYNLLIANTFFRVGFIEAWGRGIEKIKDSCKEAGNPMPEDTIKHEDVMVMFKSLVSSTDQGTNQAGDRANDNSIVTRILKVPQEEPALSQKKIADVIVEKHSAVKYCMESMKKSGIIKREGSSQKGKWIIL